MAKKRQTKKPDTAIPCDGYLYTNPRRPGFADQQDMQRQFQIVSNGVKFRIQVRYERRVLWFRRFSAWDDLGASRLFAWQPCEFDTRERAQAKVDDMQRRDNYQALPWTPVLGWPPEPRPVSIAPPPPPHPSQDTGKRQR